MEDLRPRGFFMGSRGKEIYLKTFVSINGLNIFKSNMGVLSFSSSQREEGEFEESPMKTKFIIVAREFY